MSRKKKCPAQKPTQQVNSIFSKFEASLFLHMSESMKEVRSTTLKRTCGSKEFADTLTNDLLFEINLLSDELEFTDFNTLDQCTQDECIDLASSALTIAIYALCLTKELKAISAKCLPLPSSDESFAPVIKARHDTISRRMALDRLMVAASKPGAIVEFFSSDDPLPN